MCDDAEGPSASTERWRRARIAHRCCSCHETIRPGDRYHYFSGVWDGRGDSFKHCARCWTVFELLAARAGGDSVALRLDCGIPWADNFDPAAEPVELAFLTPDEAQALAAKGAAGG